MQPRENWLRTVEFRYPEYIPFMTPVEIREQINEVVGELALPEGGLMLSAGISDAIVPLQNIVAIVESMEEFCFP